MSLNKDSRRKILAGVLLVGFFGSILAGMFVYMPEKPGFLFYFMLIVLTITVIFMIVGLLKASFAISKREELKHFGIKVSATVVG